VIGTAEKQRILELEQVLIEYVERYGLSSKAREVLGQDPNPRTNRVKSVWKHGPNYSYTEDRTLSELIRQNDAALIMPVI
jgi:hypothetical protein